MKKIIQRIVIVGMIIIALLTIANLLFTFGSLKFTVINKIVIVTFFLFLAILIINILFTKFFDKPWKVAITIIIVIIFNIAIIQTNLLLLSYNNAFNSINNTSKYKTSLIAKKDSSYNKKEDITKNTKVGIQSIKYFENGSFALEKLNEFNVTDNIKQYPTLKMALDALNKGEIDMMSASGLSDKELNKIDNNFKKNYKVITTFEGEVKNEVVTKDITSTPFTILISGVDSRSSNVDDISNGDSNILVTFDPTTGRVTTLTTPRDSYVQIQCGGFGYDKLTHSASYGGTKCVQDTLEKMYDINVDYSVRINFVGVIDIVDSLGGIEVDVPVNSLSTSPKTCEQNSHGKKDTLCWEEGKVNKFDGETALAFARNRYDQDGGDLGRGRNQQIVIEAILKKATSVNNIDTINKLLTSVSKNMQTNLQKNDIVSLYEIMVSLNNGIQIEKLYISGSTGDVNGLSVVYPNEDNIKYASYRMKVALGLVYPEYPENDYYIDGAKPSNKDGLNPLRKQLAPYDYKTPKKIEKTASK